MLREGVKRKAREKLLQFFGAEIVLQLSIPDVTGYNSEVSGAFNNIHKY